MANNTFRIPIPIGHPIYEVNNGHIEEYEVIGYRIGRMMGEDREDYEEDYGDYDGWRIEYGRDGIEGSSPISAIGNYLFQSARTWREKAMENKEKPILFNTEMVRAILDGRKTCTRRIMKPQPTAHYGIQCAKPPYVPGDILYVRETWTEECGKYYYRSDYDSDYLDPCETLSGGYPASCRNHPGCYGCTATSMRIHWHPSIHMPKEAARIWLRVVDVQLERLQDITENGAKAEGAIDNRGFIHSPENEYNRIHTAREHFAEIWNSTIKKSDIDRYGWKANPWVWVIKFERCGKPEE